MSKPKILIVYIATGKYIKMLPGFISTLNRFCPRSDKKIHIYTDQVDQVIDHPLIMGTAEDDITGIRLVEHLPWPIIALMKFKYIIESINKSKSDPTWKPDYVFYFNSNQEFLQEINEDEILFSDKLTAAVNCGWDFLGHDPLKFTYGKPVDPKSKAHIPTNEYTYVQSSMFGGPTDLLLDALTIMHEWTCYDLAHNRIPCFHDESYWNKWVYDNQDKVKILPVQYNACKLNMETYGTVGAKIAMRDSSETQYEYKDKYHAN